jgi:hypothetical protein
MRSHLKNRLSGDAPATYTLNGAVHSSTEHDTDDSSCLVIDNRSTAGTSRRQWLKEHMGKGIIRSRLIGIWQLLSSCVQSDRVRNDE